MSAAAQAKQGRIRPGELRRGEPLARYTTWRAGGPAQRLYCPADRADLAAFLAQLPAQEPLFWAGLGSNLLVRDGGVAGTVILTPGGLDALRIEGAWVRAEAGVPSPRLARESVRSGLAGLEFLAGVPGTVGGALALNAGAEGGETWAAVHEVETIDRGGRLRTRPPEDFRVGYRAVGAPPGEAFVAATWRLAPADPEALRQRVRGLLGRRKATQPVGQPTCGSVFRNPPGAAAGRLIEAAGCKGLAVGGAYVAERHANFIINAGGCAADIEALMAHVQDRVERCHGVRLEPEVHTWGEALP